MFSPFVVTDQAEKRALIIRMGHLLAFRFGTFDPLRAVEVCGLFLFFVPFLKYADGSIDLQFDIVRLQPESALLDHGNDVVKLGPFVLQGQPSN